jgi:hypothetical protein
VNVELNTARGRYRLIPAALPRNSGDELILTLAYERIDGLERVGFLCAVAKEFVEREKLSDPDALLERLAPWFEREFEQTREAALKSIRTERQPLTLRFDGGHPGPFAR